MTEQNKQTTVDNYQHSFNHHKRLVNTNKDNTGTKKMSYWCDRTPNYPVYPNNPVSPWNGPSPVYPTAPQPHPHGPMPRPAPNGPWSNTPPMWPQPRDFLNH